MEVNVWLFSLLHDPNHGFYEKDRENVIEIIKNMEEPYLIKKEQMSEEILNMRIQAV